MEPEIMEQILAKQLDLTGWVWEKSEKRYRAVKWWRFRQKFTHWLDLMRCGVAFVNAIDAYNEYLIRKIK